MYCIHWWKSTMLFLVRYHRNEVMSKHPEGSFLIKSKRVFIYMPRDNLVYYYYPLYSSLLDFVFLFISLYSLFSTSLCKEFVWFHLFPNFYTYISSFSSTTQLFTVVTDQIEHECMWCWNCALYFPRSYLKPTVLKYTAIKEIL